MRIPCGQEDNSRTTFPSHPCTCQISAAFSPGRTLAFPISSATLVTEVSPSYLGGFGSGQGVMPVPTCLLSWHLGLQQSQPSPPLGAKG